MIKYKIDVMKELADIGVNSTITQKTGLFSQATMTKFKRGDTNISINSLNRLCAVLEMQPRDIIKYVETEEDVEKYISIVNKK